MKHFLSRLLASCATFSKRRPATATSRRVRLEVEGLEARQLMSAAPLAAVADLPHAQAVVEHAATERGASDAMFTMASASAADAVQAGAATTLLVKLDYGITRVTPVSKTGFPDPRVSPFWIKIDNEVMKVVDHDYIQGGWRVQRLAEQMQEHAAGATIQLYNASGPVAPVAPNLQVKILSTTQVELVWNRVPGTRTFSLWKSDGQQNTWIRDVAGSVTSYRVGNLLPGSTTYFTVGAVNPAGHAFSPWVTGTTARATLVGTVLSVYGSDYADTILVGQTNDRISIDNVPILAQGKFETDVYAGRVGVIKVFGKKGDDIIRLDRGNQPIYARALIRGDEGSDFIVGSQGGANTIWGDTGLSGTHGKSYALDGDDTIYGGAKSDILYGEVGNDKLYGMAGIDKLFGGYGGDWLETAPHSPLQGPRQSSELANLGPDEGRRDDWSANNWVVAGTRMQDVQQEGSNTCSFLCSLASVARTGTVSLANQIRYLGNNDYAVKLFDGTQWTEQTVHFDGSYNTDVDPEPAQRGEYWTILFQRAYVQMVGLPADGQRIGLVGESKALNSRALTGKPSSWAGYPLSLNNFREIEVALRAGRNVVAATFPAFAISSPLLVGGHAYTVLSVSRDSLGRPAWIRIRNPWGTDGGTGGDGVDDGFVRIRWSDFIKDVKWITFN